MFRCESFNQFGLVARHQIWIWIWITQLTVGVSHRWLSWWQARSWASGSADSVAMSWTLVLIHLPLFKSTCGLWTLSDDFSACVQWRKHLNSCPHGLTFTRWGCCSLYLWHKPTELAHPFLSCSCVCFWLYGPFNCISFYKFSWQVSAFSLCSPGLISAIYLFVKVSLSPDVILCGWLD